MSTHEQPRRTTRRGLLAVATVGAGAALGGVVAVPVAGYVLAPVTEEQRFRPASLGAVEQFAGERGFRPTAAPFIGDPAAPLTSRELAYVHRTGGAGTDWLGEDAMFVVFSNRCTHVGCPTQATGAGFSCPCHGSQYDERGARIAGPAVRPLDRFQWEVRGGELWVTQRWSVLLDGDRVAYFPVKAPGQPLAGEVPLADALYPAVTYDQPSTPDTPPNLRRTAPG
ncbi:MAG TPA: Rieske (2Fe-2S) protein [Gaiellales bacterium]|jgi:Rieske Fe-S protein